MNGLFGVSFSTMTTRRWGDCEYTNATESRDRGCLPIPSPVSELPFSELNKRNLKRVSCAHLSEGYRRKDS